MDITVQEFLSMNPKGLAANQHAVLKDLVVRRLRALAKEIEKENYLFIYESLGDSPSGDGYGKYNQYIDFSDCGNNIEDISDALDKLIELKDIMSVNQEEDEE